MTQPETTNPPELDAIIIGAGVGGLGRVDEVHDHAGDQPREIDDDGGLRDRAVRGGEHGRVERRAEGLLHLEAVGLRGGASVRVLRAPRTAFEARVDRLRVVRAAPAPGARAPASPGTRT